MKAMLFLAEKANLEGKEVVRLAHTDGVVRLQDAFMTQ